MGFFTSLMQTFEQRMHPSQNNGWESIFGGGWNTAAGVDVTPDRSLNSAVVYACVRVLAESIASLPLVTYERTDGGKERAFDAPIYRVLHNEPNGEMTSFELREYLMRSLLTWGNGFCEIERTNGGDVRALWPLRPDRMKLMRRGGRLIYVYNLDGAEIPLPTERILHVRGMGSGLWGESPIRQQGGSVGLDLAMEDHASLFFGNGARPGGVLIHPGTLSDKAYSNLKASWTEEHGGLSNAHRLRILEEGMQYQAITIPPEEAQFLESRKFQRSVIAGWYRVPPHMIGDLERATFSNIEHQGIEFVVQSLRPWLVRLEQSMSRALLTQEERSRYVIEHLVDGLLRGDTASRYQAYSIAIQNGWMSRNEVRGLENLNPYDGGDEYLVPLNMASASDEGAATDESVRHEHTHGRREIRADEDFADLRIERQQLAAAFVGLFEDSIARLSKREIADLRRAVEKYLIKSGNLTAWDEWLEQFYDDLRAAIPPYLEPAVAAIAKQAAASVTKELGQAIEADQLSGFAGEYIDNFAGGYVASHHRQIKALVEESAIAGNEIAPAIVDRLDGWEATEAQRTGRSQAVESLNAFVIAAYGAGGVRLLRWLSTGDSCPICDGLNGKVVGIEGYFVQAGDTLGSGETVMTFSSNRRHAPLHEGCDCTVMAA